MMEDSALYERCLAGDVRAFEHIIERYQSLICAIAYSAAGSRVQSEDLAQETFVAAWNNLPKLRDPAKFRAWLCGIVRNLALNRRRQAIKNPISTERESLDLPESPALDFTPREQAIEREEEEILWRELSKIPEIYREPMILYYRQNQSISIVAEILEISEDAVKQRLARGRKSLQDQMAAFVEEILGRAQPSPNLSAMVLASISLSSPAWKTTGCASAAVPAGFFGKILSFLFSLPFLSWLAGMGVGFYLNLRWQLKTIKSPKEKRLIVHALIFLLFIFLFSHISGQACFNLAFSWPLESLLLLIIAISIAFFILFHFWSRWFQSSRKTIREREGLPPLPDPSIREDGKPVYPFSVMALGLILTNAGAMLVPFLPFTLAARDATGQILIGSLFLLTALPGVIGIYRNPRRYGFWLSLTTTIGSILALSMIDLRWSTWLAAPGMAGYLTPLSWRLLNGFLFTLVGYSLWEFIAKNKNVA